MSGLPPFTAARALVRSCVSRPSVSADAAPGAAADDEVDTTGAFFASLPCEGDAGATLGSDSTVIDGGAVVLSASRCGCSFVCAGTGGPLVAFAEAGSVFDSV